MSRPRIPQAVPVPPGGAAPHAPSLDPLALGMAVLAFVWWEVILALRYRAFDFWDWDLAIFAHFLWNAAHGTSYSTIMGLPFLGNHANVLGYLLVPLYAVLPHPYLLLTLKVACCTFAAIPLALLARDTCGVGVARCLVAAYLLYPPLTHAINYEFHYESLAPLLVFWLWFAFLKDRRRLFLAVAIPALLLKENIPLLVAMFGVAGMVRRKTKAWWCGITALSLAWFAIAVFVIVPAARGGEASPHWMHYEHLGGSPTEIVKNLVLHPGLIIQAVVTPEKLQWLWQLFAPVGLLAVVGLDAVLVALPLFAQHLLSNAPVEHTIHFHYGALPAPFILVGALLGIKRLSGLWPTVRALPIFLAAGVVVCAVWTQALWGAIPQLLQSPERLFRDDLDIKRAELIQRIPDEAPVIASFYFLPELSRRERLYGFHNVYMNRDSMARRDPYVLPPDAEYVLIDVNDFQFTGWMTRRHPPLAQNVFAFYHNTPWRVEEIVESLLLLRRGEGSSLDLYEVSQEGVALEPGTFWRFQGGVRLRQLEREELGRGPGGSTVPLDLTWEVASRVEPVYGMKLIWMSEAGDVVKTSLHPLGYRIYPTWMWQPGRLIREHLFLLIPSRVASGRYRLIGQLIDERTQQVVPLEGGAEGGPRKQAVLLGTIVVTSDREG